MKPPRVPASFTTPAKPVASEHAFRELRAQLRELTSICTSFSQPFQTDNLHRRIVTSAKELASADGCSLYRLHGDALHFEVVSTQSLGLLAGATLGEKPDFDPIALRDDDGSEAESVAARCVHRKSIINLSEVNKQPHYEGSRTEAFDKATGYETNSILAVPVRYRGGKITGVLQLVNAKNALGAPVPFERHHVETAECMTGLIGLIWHLQDLSGDD